MCYRYKTQDEPATCLLSRNKTLRLQSKAQNPCLKHRPALEKLPPSFLAHLLQKHLVEALASQQAFKWRISVTCSHIPCHFSMQAAAVPGSAQEAVMQGYGGVDSIHLCVTAGTPLLVLFESTIYTQHLQRKTRNPHSSHRFQLHKDTDMLWSPAQTPPKIFVFIAMIGLKNTDCTKRHIDTLFKEKKVLSLGNKIRIGGPVKHACLKTIFV